MSDNQTGGIFGNIAAWGAVIIGHLASVNEILQAVAFISSIVLSVTTFLHIKKKDKTK